MAQRFLLDTNIASHVIRGDMPLIREKLISIPMEAVMISAIT
jgi:tRNA(fMet)-specific endonuclease VapC